MWAPSWKYNRARRRRLGWSEERALRTAFLVGRLSPFCCLVGWLLGCVRACGRPTAHESWPRERERRRYKRESCFTLPPPRRPPLCSFTTPLSLLHNLHPEETYCSDDSLLIVRCCATSDVFRVAWGAAGGRAGGRGASSGRARPGEGILLSGYSCTVWHNGILLFPRNNSMGAQRLAPQFHYSASRDL